MKKASLALLLALPLLLSACATPVTTLKNPATGQVARCGGERSGSAAGGLIGYEMQKNDAEKCVKAYKKQGFNVVN